MIKKKPPIEDIVNLACEMWFANTKSKFPRTEFQNHIEELFFGRKDLWYGIIHKIITIDELSIGLSQHIQTWIAHQIKIDENIVVGVFDNKEILKKILLGSI